MHLGVDGNPSTLAAGRDGALIGGVRIFVPTLVVRRGAVADDRRNVRPKKIGTIRVRRGDFANRHWRVGDVELRGAGVPGFPSVSRRALTSDGL